MVMEKENKYFDNTSKEMKKDINKLIDDIKKNVLENESNHAVVLSRLDSVCSLLQITLIHINSLNKQNQCVTTDEEAGNAE
jgi:hypothetical protein